MKFGFIKREKEKNKLLFDFPYLVMEPKPEGTGKVHKFWLKGLNIRDLLELGESRDNKLSWVFDENKDDNTFYIVNVTDVTEEVHPLITLNIGLDFNNKSLHKRMSNLMGLDPKKFHNFRLEKVDGGIYNLPAVKIESLASDPEVIADEAMSEINGLFN
jgi:hypothetical protein